MVYCSLQGATDFWYHEIIKKKAPIQGCWQTPSKTRRISVKDINYRLGVMTHMREKLESEMCISSHCG